MKPIYNNDDLDKYRQVNGLLNDEGQRIFCDRINNYLDKKDKDKDKEIERLNNNWKELRQWLINHKHNENTKEHYLVVDYGELLNKINELENSK